MAFGCFLPSASVLSANLDPTPNFPTRSWVFRYEWGPPATGWVVQPRRVWWGPIPAPCTIPAPADRSGGRTRTRAWQAPFATIVCSTRRRTRSVQSPKRFVGPLATKVTLRLQGVNPMAARPLTGKSRTSQLYIRLQNHVNGSQQGGNRVARKQDRGDYWRKLGNGSGHRQSGAGRRRQSRHHRTLGRTAPQRARGIGRGGAYNRSRRHRRGRNARTVRGAGPRRPCAVHRGDP